MDNPISKLTRRFYERKNLLPNKKGDSPSSAYAVKELGENVLLLNNAALMYASLWPAQKDRQLNWDYYHGKQFNELVPSPDGCGMMTEYKYIVNQGYVPLSINIILPKIKAIVGVYRGESMEPYAISRVRDEQKLGELVTKTLLYASDIIHMPEEIIKGYKEFQVSGIPIFRTGYRWDKERKIEEVYAKLMNLNDMFWDYNPNDSFFENVHTIGCLHDMSLAEVLSQFAKSPEEAEKINAAYKNVQWKYPDVPDQFENLDKAGFRNFYEPTHRGQCRVIEIWTEEAHGVYPCWDTAKGEPFTLPATPESKAYIEAENAKRINEIVENGGSPDDAALIVIGYEDPNTGERIEYRVDTDWVVRYMTPTGYVLHEEVSPYIHGSHPFVLGAYPLTNGEIHSNVSDLRNVQRMINRLLSSAEFERMNRAKGAIAVNMDILDRSNVSLKKFTKEYTSPKGVIGLRWKEGEKLVERLADQTGNADDNNKLQFYMEIANEVSGAHGSLRGERPTSGTPASLYAQETQNASNNIIDGMEWYNSIVNRVYYKLMMMQLQYYDKRRFLEIAGAEFEQQIDYIINTPARQRQTLFDLQLIKSPQTGFARAQREQMLQTLFESGAIPASLWLDNTSLNGADKISEQLKQYQKEQAEAQQKQAMAQQAQQIPPQGVM